MDYNEKLQPCLAGVAAGVAVSANQPALNVLRPASEQEGPRCIQQQERKQGRGTVSTKPEKTKSGAPLLHLKGCQGDRYGVSCN